jgi:hypothetical protein
MRYRVLSGLRFYLFGVVVLLSTTAVWATPILSVDVENNNSPVTAAGFTSWPTLGTSGTVSSTSMIFSGISAANVDDGTFSATIAGWTTGAGGITSASTIASRTRSAPSFSGVTNADMLRDFVFNSSSGNQGRTYMTLAFTGLTASKAYNITVFSYDNNNGGGVATNWTTIAPPSTSLGYSGAATFVAHTNLANAAANSIPTTNDGGSSPTNVNNPTGGATFSLTTDGSGNATLYAWGGNGVNGNTSNSGVNPYLNGFTIESVPEPSTCILMALGGVVLLARRKKS